jgi:hypothetical protein
LQNGHELRYTYIGEDNTISNDLIGEEWDDAGEDVYDGGNQVWIDDQIQAFWTPTSSLEFQSESWGQFAFANATSGQVLAIRNFAGNKFVIDGNIVSKSKPDPEVFLKGAAALNVSPSHTVVFEDAVSGVAAAKTGGFFCVGIGQAEDLIDADFVVRDLSQINIELLNKTFFSH